MFDEFLLRNYIDGFDKPPRITGPWPSLEAAVAVAACGLQWARQRAYAHDASHWVEADGEWRLAGFLWPPEGPHRSPFVIVRKPVPETLEDRIAVALQIAVDYGGIDGSHHKDWVIDQMARVLAGDGYDELVAQARSGRDGPHTYDWPTGSAPGWPTGVAP